MIVASLPFGFTATEFVVIAGAIAYVVSLARDWRPVRTLRAENRDLRQMLEVAEKKISALEAQVKSLEKATDLSAVVAEHAKIAAVLERVVKRLDSLDGAVHANTAVIEAVARGSALRETLDDMEGKP